MNYGIHIHDIKNYIKDFPANIIRIHDCGCCWADLEKSKDNWDFSKLDKIVDLAIENNQEIILTLGMTPGWATAKKNKINVYGREDIKTSPPDNIEDWKNYIKTIGERYSNIIKYYEIWNEVDWYYFYTGSIGKLVKMTKEASKILKELNPDVKIVCPSISSLPVINWWTLFWYYIRAKKYIDILNMHYYQIPNIPKWILNLYIFFTKLVSSFKKPLWITEIGFSNFKVFNIVKFSKILKLIRIAKKSKIDNFIYYALDNNYNDGGLIYFVDKKLNENGLLYKYTIKEER